MAQKKKVYCVIAMYNGLKWIDYCLGSLMKSDYPVQVIAVDDASDDGTSVKVKDHYPKVDLITLKKNRGYTVANNIGITKALDSGADYLFILNLDTCVDQHCIGNLVTVAEKFPDFGIVSPMHLNGTGTGLDYPFSTYIEPVRCPNLYSDLYMNKTKEIYPIQSVNSAAWLVRRDVFETVGLFDEIFRLYGVDDNYVNRVRYYGFKIGITPNAVIHHDRQNRSFNQDDFKMLFHKQFTRMQVISLNPNLSLSAKLFLLFRKSMSDFMRNIQGFHFIESMKNIWVFVYGSYFTFRHRNRHNVLEKGGIISSKINSD